MRIISTIVAWALIVLLCVSFFFLLHHSNIMPEALQEYSRVPADDAQLSDAERELMLLLGMPAEPPRPEPRPLRASFFGGVIGTGVLISALIFAWLTGRWAGWDILCTIVLGLVMSRLVYCLVNYGHYFIEFNDLRPIFILADGGFSLLGALLGAALGMLLYSKIAAVMTMPLLNMLTPSLLLFTIFSRMAELGTYAGYGPAMDHFVLFITIQTPAGIRLNTAFFAVFASMALFVLAIIPVLKYKEEHLFVKGVLWLGVVTLLTESLRRDGYMQWGFVHVQQIMAMLMAAGAVLIPALMRGKWKTALLVSLAVAGILIGIEFALDKTGISHLLLYGVFIAVCALYTGYGMSQIKKIDLEARA